jgi:hypothetical protein
MLPTAAYFAASEENIKRAEAMQYEFMLARAESVRGIGLWLIPFLVAYAIGMAGLFVYVSSTAEPTQQEAR